MGVHGVARASPPSPSLSPAIITVECLGCILIGLFLQMTTLTTCCPQQFEASVLTYVCSFLAAGPHCCFCQPTGVSVPQTEGGACPPPVWWCGPASPRQARDRCEATAPARLLPFLRECPVGTPSAFTTHACTGPTSRRSSGLVAKSL